VTEVLPVDPSTPQPARIARAAECLRHGGLVAFPTETVYGLGVHALDRAAVRRLFEAKGRPSHDPLIVHVSSLDHARLLLADVPSSAAALAARFWPGPLTLVMRRSALVPDEVTAALDTVAIRVPAHPVARALIDAAAVPVAAPSANLFSRPSPTSAAHVLEDLQDRIDIVIDGGATHVGVESTVLDLSHGEPIVLRPGAVTLEMLRHVLPAVVMRGDATGRDDEAQRSPGLLSKHYAPRTPLTLYTGRPEAALACMRHDIRRLTSAGTKVVILATDEDAIDLRADLDPALTQIIRVGTRDDLHTVARRLYAALREADARDAGVIVMYDIDPGEGLAEAIRDRLRRAASEIREA
jgi:L-threonylcarbamoyladenylate synthase